MAECAVVASWIKECVRRCPRSWSTDWVGDEMADPEYDAIIVGAGHNGLVAASYLAAEGLKVLVLERLRRVGGAIATEEVFPGFHVPYCAYICHMLHGKVIDDLELRKHGFDLYHMKWSYFQPFFDGGHIIGWRTTQELYREIRTVYDRSLAPPGMHVMSSWSLYYPAHPKDGPWDAAKKQELIELHLEILSQFAPNFRECVQDLTLETPADIERRIGMTDGCIRHLDVTPQQYFSRRMPYRAPVRGLYLCGSGTHPGGELSGAPGHNCARAILRDLEGKAEDRV